MKDIRDYEEFLYNIQIGKENELDIFYLFFGIVRQIIWEISPFLKVYMIDEQYIQIKNIKKTFFIL